MKNLFLYVFLLISATVTAQTVGTGGTRPDNPGIIEKGRVPVSTSTGKSLWTRLKRTNNLGYVNGVFTWTETDGVDSLSKTANLDSRYLQTSSASTTYVPFTGGTLSGALTLANSVRVGGTGSTDNNTYLGKNTLISRTSGTNNTAIGQAVLSSNTSGSNNTVVGNNSGASISTGQYNTIIGAGLASSLSVGSYNTIIGAGTLSGITSGTSNTVILADGQGNRRFNIFSDGNAMLGTNTYYTETRLGVFGGANGANIDVRGNSGAFVDQSTLKVEGNDYDTNTRSAYLQYRGATYTGTSNGFSNNNLARLVLNGNNNLVMTGIAKPLIFGTNFTEAMRIDSTNKIVLSSNLGIGSSPTAKLHIKDGTDNNLLVRSATNGGISGTDGTQVVSINDAQNAYKNLSLNGSNVFLNPVTGGNVGVNTVLPISKLDVNGDLRVVNGGKFTGQAESWYASGGQVLIDYASNQGRIQSYDGLAAQNKDLLLQWNGGNVGIGGTPTEKLHVFGKIKNNNDADLASTAGTVFVGSSVGTNTTGLEVGTSRSGTGISYMDLGGESTNSDYGLRFIRSGLASSIYHAGTGDLDINSISTGSLKFSTANAERMKIFNDGNVAIGNTTNAGFKLNVNGSTAFTGSNSVIAFYNGSSQSIYNSTASRSISMRRQIAGEGDSKGIAWFGYDSLTYNLGLIMKDNGSVGIGTHSPTKKLEIANAGEASIRLNNTSANSWDLINTTPIGNFQLVRGGSNIHFHIGNTGYVGIGTTSPETKLHLVTPSDGITFSFNSTNQYRASIKTYWNSASDTRMSFGINVASSGTPDETFHVYSAGQIKLKPLTTAQINAISSPSEGMMAWNSDIKRLCSYDGTGWKRPDGTNM